MRYLRYLVKHPSLLTLQGAEFNPNKVHEKNRGWSFISKESRDEIYSLAKEAHVFIPRAVKPRHS